MIKKKILPLLLVLLGIFLIDSLLYGKLFPLSPVVLGFDKHEFHNTIIYVQKRSPIRDYIKIDSFTKSVEKFHKLKFTRKPIIYIFSDKDTYKHRSITNARFCAYPNGTLVVSPWAIDESLKGTISLEIYTKHELSHILLYQHMSYYAAYYYPPWLLEGIAVYSTNQMGTSWYPSKKQTYEIIKNGNYFPPSFYKTSKEDNIKLHIDNQIAFMYSEFACIVDYLIGKYGENTFYTYMNGLLTTQNHDKLFKKIYKTNFDIFLKDFRENTKK